MKNFGEILKYMAVVFSYPDENYKEAVGHLELLLASYTDCHSQYQKFFRYIHTTPLSDIEELFTYTFDMNPSTCLEIGWHLYGEEYQRGQFLVNMRQSLKEAGIQESIELPDHLSHCLLLLSALDAKESQDYVKTFLLKPLHKISDELDAKNPYSSMMEILIYLLENFIVRQVSHAEIVAQEI